MYDRMPFYKENYKFELKLELTRLMKNRFILDDCYNFLSSWNKIDDIDLIKLLAIIGREHYLEVIIGFTIRHCQMLI